MKRNEWVGIYNPKKELFQMGGKNDLLRLWEY